MFWCVEFSETVSLSCLFVYFSSPDPTRPQLTKRTRKIIMANRGLSRRTTNKWAIDLTSRYGIEIFTNSCFIYLFFNVWFSFKWQLKLLSGMNERFCIFAHNVCVPPDLVMCPIDSLFSIVSFQHRLGTQSKEFSMWFVQSFLFLFCLIPW